MKQKYNSKLFKTREEMFMSDFKDKCGDVLTGGATGAASGGSIGQPLASLEVLSHPPWVQPLEAPSGVLPVCFQIRPASK